MGEELAAAARPGPGQEPATRRYGAWPPKSRRSRDGVGDCCTSCTTRPGCPPRTRTRACRCPAWCTPEQVTEAAAASGPAFDALLLKHLREHMDQGVRLATSEEKSGVEPQTRALAAQMIARSAKGNSRSGHAVPERERDFRAISSAIFVIHTGRGRPHPSPQSRGRPRSSRIRQLVVRVQRRTAVRLVEVEAARVALQATVDAVADQGVRGSAGPTRCRSRSGTSSPARWTAGRLDMLPLTGNAILNSIIGTATGWLAGQMPSTGYAMWLLWSGVSRWMPFQQLGACMRMFSWRAGRAVRREVPVERAVAALPALDRAGGVAELVLRGVRAADQVPQARRGRPHAAVVDDAGLVVDDLPAHRLHRGVAVEQGRHPVAGLVARRDAGRAAGLQATPESTSRSWSCCP